MRQQPHFYNYSLADFSYFSDKKEFIAWAAWRPAPMAEMTVAPPVTISPPAKTPFLVVARLSWSTSSVPRRVNSRSEVPAQQRVGAVANGDHRQIKRHLEFRTFNWDRTSAAAAVRLTQFHAL